MTAIMNSEGACRCPGSVARISGMRGTRSRHDAIVLTTCPTVHHEIRNKRIVKRGQYGFGGICGIVNVCGVVIKVMWCGDKSVMLIPEHKYVLIMFYEFGTRSSIKRIGKRCQNLVSAVVTKQLLQNKRNTHRLIFSTGFSLVIMKPNWSVKFLVQPFL